MSHRSKSVPWYDLPAALFLLGILSIALLIWKHTIHEEEHANFALISVVKDLQTTTAAAHVWLEEALAEEGDVAGRRELAQSKLTHAMKLSEALLHGGESGYGTALQPPQDPRLQKQAEKFARLLSEFTALAKLRLVRGGTAGRGSELDDQFHGVFTKILDTADVLESIAEKNMTNVNTRTTRLFLGILFAWSFIVIMATAGLWHREAKRKRAEDALQEARDGLEIKVSERTQELAITNAQLGQELVERSRAEAALRESERKFRGLSDQFHTLLDAIPDSITLLSPDLRILWANKGAALAAKGREIAGRYCYNLWHDASEPCAGCSVLRSFETGRTESFQSTAIDGWIWDLRAFPMRGEDGRVESVIEIATDITDKTLLQKQAVRMAQLASLGELAAGVAHEINNPVNGIINCAELLVGKTGADSREHELGKRIIREGERIAYIVKALLSFSRQESEELVPADVRDLLADTLALIEAQMKKEGINLRLDADNEALLVRAQPQRMEQVFLNIINNARDALNEKYPDEAEEKALSITARRFMIDNGPRVRIVFHDRGAGIPAEALGKIMHPFYSTKPRGKGTGLGLSISHGIVENHGGKLSINSVKGEFTEAVVELPLMA